MSRLAVSTPVSAIATVRRSENFASSPVRGTAIDVQHELANLICGEARLRRDGARAFDRRMREIAGGVILEEIAADIPAAGRIGERRRRIEIGPMRRGETLGTFEHVGA